MQVDDYADADRREVNPPMEVESATQSTGGTIDWWVKERQRGGSGTRSRRSSTTLSLGTRAIRGTLRRTSRRARSTSYQRVAVISPSTGAPPRPRGPGPFGPLSPQAAGSGSSEA
jgi:hypothetical protein